MPVNFSGVRPRRRGTMGDAARLMSEQEQLAMLEAMQRLQTGAAEPRRPMSVPGNPALAGGPTVSYGGTGNWRNRLQARQGAAFLRKQGQKDAFAGAEAQAIIDNRPEMELLMRRRQRGLMGSPVEPLADEERRRRIDETIAERSEMLKAIQRPGMAEIGARRDVGMAGIDVDREEIASRERLGMEDINAYRDVAKGEVDAKEYAENMRYRTAIDVAHVDLKGMTYAQKEETERTIVREKGATGRTTMTEMGASQRAMIDAVVQLSGQKEGTKQVERGIEGGLQGKEIDAKTAKELRVIEGVFKLKGLKITQEGDTERLAMQIKGMADAQVGDLDARRYEIDMNYRAAIDVMRGTVDGTLAGKRIDYAQAVETVTIMSKSEDFKAKLAHLMRMEGIKSAERTANAHERGETKRTEITAYAARAMSEAERAEPPGARQERMLIANEAAYAQGKERGRRKMFHGGMTESEVRQAIQGAIQMYGSDTNAINRYAEGLAAGQGSFIQTTANVPTGVRTKSFYRDILRDELAKRGQRRRSVNGSEAYETRRRSVNGSEAYETRRGH